MSHLFRDDPDFKTAIEKAAEQHGLADPAFVEKDYWVTQVLRVLATDHAHDITFKGGTSLSKGYDLIRRFSEDVDVLVIPDGGASNKDREGKLLGITGNIATSVGLEWREARAPGRGRNASRGDLLLFKPQHQTFTGLPFFEDAYGVLLETGYGDGHEPKEVVSVLPLIAGLPEIKDEGFTDLERFQIGVLEPRRTLIEKLYVVHHAASQFADNGKKIGRIGRHYYDIHMLLAHDDTLKRLERERERFEGLCEEVERISGARYNGTTPRPADGFGVSPGFTSEVGSELRIWLESEYEREQVLIPRGVHVPTFGAVLKRIEEHRELL